MDYHSGSWQVGGGDTEDVIFTSSAGLTLLLTISKSSSVETYLYVNGAAAANGTMSSNEQSRTFRLAGATEIKIKGYSTVSGTYQVSVL